MADPLASSGIRDNYNRGIVAEFLKSHIKDGSYLSVVSAFFTIYAYDALKNYLDRIEHMDFLFGDPHFVRSLDPNKTEKKSFILDSTGLKLANHLQQKRVAKECASWIQDKVSIRSIRQSNLLHGKMYHVATNGIDQAIVGSSLVSLFCQRFLRNNVRFVFKKSVSESPRTTTPSVAASNP